MIDRKSAALCLVASLASTGCASVVNGSRQSIGISSSPSGAGVVVDGARVGVTPMIADIERGKTHVVSIEMPGYHTRQLTLTKSMSGRVWGNLLWSPAGFLIGLGIDAVSGSMYKLSPEQLVTTLHRETVVPRRAAAPAVTSASDTPL